MSEPLPFNELIPVSFFQDKWCTGNYHDFDEWNKPLSWQMLGFILENYSHRSFASKEDAPLYCPTVFTNLKQCKKSGEPYEGWPALRRQNRLRTRLPLEERDSNGRFRGRVCVMHPARLENIVV
jgi:hypothetical protein